MTEATVVEALTQFRIETKPEGIERHRGKYDTLITALKNLANDKAIVLDSGYLQGQKLTNFRLGLQQAAKKQAQLKIGVVPKNNQIFIFTRS